MALSGFLMVFFGWRQRLQGIVIVLSFLRLLKLHKLAVGKTVISGGWVLLGVTVRQAMD